MKQNGTALTQQFHSTSGWRPKMDHLGSDPLDAQCEAGFEKAMQWLNIHILNRFEKLIRFDIQKI